LEIEGQMARVVGIQFKPATKIYHFAADGFEDLAPGEYVIVETARGREMGKVVCSPHEVPEEKIVGQLKTIVRRVEPRDLVEMQRFKAREAEALARCKEKVEEHKLPMKLVRAEYNFDGSRLVFYFTAEKRVDFRALVRDLARIFKTRIELRQIGVRDETKMMDGLGRCGYPLCCSTWLTEFKSVSIKAAKHQDLPLSPMEISGICGRLLCCLNYEDDFYREAKAHMPKVGQLVMTPHGQARVRSVNVLKETLEVELESEVTVEVPAKEVRIISSPRGGAGRSARRKQRS